eukprot:6202939-Pleurochrysis_carterae.AAC.1
MNNESIFYTDMLTWATSLRIAHPLPGSLQEEGGDEAAAAASEPALRVLPATLTSVSTRVSSARVALGSTASVASTVSSTRATRARPRPRPATRVPQFLRHTTCLMKIRGWERCSFGWEQALHAVHEFELVLQMLGSCWKQQKLALLSEDQFREKRKSVDFG